MYPAGFENKMDVESRLDRLVTVTTKLLELTTQMAEANAKLRKDVDELTHRLDEKEKFYGRGGLNVNLPTDARGLW